MAKRSKKSSEKRETKTKLSSKETMENSNTNNSINDPYSFTGESNFNSISLSQQKSVKIKDEMETQYLINDIVLAKLKNKSKFWPAKVTELPEANNNDYEVSFFDDEHNR